MTRKRFHCDYKIVNEKEGEIWIDELANRWIFRNGKWKPMVYIKEADEWEEE